jgi:hypothetical protein
MKKQQITSENNNLYIHIFIKFLFGTPPKTSFNPLAATKGVLPVFLQTYIAFAEKYKAY